MPPASRKQQVTATSNRKNLPRGGGMASGVKGVEQQDGEDGEGEGGRKARGGNATDGEELSLEALTLSEFNRWLVTEENWTMAEEVREQHIEGEQRRKARDDRHRERGQLRQQNTVEQMKEAKTKVDAHRRTNLEMGSAVKRDVLAWTQAKIEEKDAWAKYGQSIKETNKASELNAVREALTQSKKAAGESVRGEVTKLKAECEALREEYAERNRQRAEKVKSETEEPVITAAQKVFFLQRQKKASEGRALSQQMSEQRTKNRMEFITAFKARAAKVTGARDKARTSRTALQEKRAAEASELREKKQGLIDQRQALLTEHSVSVKEAVNASISTRFVHPENSRRMLQHPHYTEVAAVVADVTSSVSREIAASPRRSRRPGAQAALTMGGQSPGGAGSSAQTRRV